MSSDLKAAPYTPRHSAPTSRLPRLELWRAPDPRLANAAADGERMIALSRAVICVLLLVTSTAHVVSDPGNRFNHARLALVLLAAVSSLWAYALLRKRHP
ncbi:MAG: hypothetical protein M3N43_06305, partial [Actinomycetota bacterium]|nr:hypothetical protein [Actinomycetota bacterium]